MYPKRTKAGGGERGQYIMKNYNDSTIRFALEYPGVPDADILCKAVRTVIEQVDVLHGSLITNRIGAWWRLNNTDDPDDYFQLIDTKEDPIQAARSRLLIPVDPENKTQIHCTLVRSRDKSCIVVRMSHLVVDGSDGKYVLQKLTEVYNLLAAGGDAAALNFKKGSRAPEQVYEGISPDDMKKLKRGSLSPSSVRSFYPYPDDQPGTGRLITAKISPETMTAARIKAKKAGASVNDLIITAAYHAYAKMEQVDPSAPMCMNATIDLRRHCRNGDSEGLCNISGSFLTLLENGCTNNFDKTLAVISEQTNRIKANPFAGLEGMPVVHALARKAPLGLLIKIMQKVYRTAPVGITNLGNLRCSDFAMGGIVPIGGICGGVMKKKPAMQITAVSFDNACVLSVLTECTDTDAALLQKTLDDMVMEITAYSAKP